MAVNETRDMRTELEIGATEGSFKTLTKDRGGEMSADTLVSRALLDDGLYDLHNLPLAASPAPDRTLGEAHLGTRPSGSSLMPTGKAAKKGRTHDVTPTHRTGRTQQRPVNGTVRTRAVNGVPRARKTVHNGTTRIKTVNGRQVGRVLNGQTRQNARRAR